MTVYIKFFTGHACLKTDEVEVKFIKFNSRKDAQRVLDKLPKGESGRLIEIKEYEQDQRRFDFYNRRPFFSRITHFVEQFIRADVVTDEETGQRVVSLYR